MKQNRPNINTTIVQHQQWSGPLPAPEALAQYNNIVPDAAERILRMAEKEQEHRHKAEDKKDKSRNKIAMTSTILAFICVLVLIGLVVFAISEKENGTALAAIISAIAAVAGVFGLEKLMKTKD